MFIAVEKLTLIDLCAFVIYPPKSDHPFLVAGQIWWQQEIKEQTVAGTKWLLWKSGQEKDLAVEYAYTGTMENG